MKNTTSYLGYGLGLRSKHYQYILANKPSVDWFEIMTEDYMSVSGRPLYFLEQIRQHYSIVMHGVSLSIGSIDPLNREYLTKFKQLIKKIEPAWVSDHLCWTGIHGLNTHDLLPLPYTEESLKHVVERVKQVQDFLGQQILLENPSTYIEFSTSQLTEWDFMRELAIQADCLILLDVNNIYVSAFNHGFKADDYLQAIPVERVGQFHLAGHENFGNHIIDTHNQPVIDPVWDLFIKAVQRFGDISTMIERDDNIPEFPELFAELQYAKKIAENVKSKVK